MTLRLTLATATAMGLLMGVAAAGSSNTLYIWQDGENNIADIKQAPGNYSDIGQALDPALQQGKNNRTTFGVSTGTPNNNNDIVSLKQLGNWNLFDAAASGGSSNNTLNTFREQGTGNGARVSWRQNSNSTIDSVAIYGDKNTVSIHQGNFNEVSNWNYVGSVSITGSNNGIASGNGNAHADEKAAIHINQIGTANHVTQSTIVGSDNHDASPHSSSAFNKVHEIFQKGIGNGQGSSIASTYGSNGNWIRINQDGNWNNFKVYQGRNSASTQNRFQITQIGSSNSASGTQYGDYNFVTVEQNSDGNTARADISGDHNGGGILSGAAGALASTNGLSSGLIKQNGLNNTATLDIIGSNNNEFALLQSGNYNTINGTVTGGGGNSATVVQNGSGNMSNFIQSGGGGNIVAVNQ